jgi:hypothetical protein
MNRLSLQNKTQLGAFSSFIKTRLIGLYFPVAWCLVAIIAAMEVYYFNVLNRGDGFHITSVTGVRIFVGLFVITIIDYNRFKRKWRATEVVTRHENYILFDGSVFEYGYEAMTSRRYHWSMLEKFSEQRDIFSFDFGVETIFARVDMQKDKALALLLRSTALAKVSENKNNITIQTVQ